MLKVKDVAERLKMSSACVYALVACERIGFYRIGVGRGAIRFSEEDVTAYLDSCRHGRRQEDVPERLNPRLKHIRLP